MTTDNYTSEHILVHVVQVNFRFIDKIYIKCSLTKVRGRAKRLECKNVIKIYQINNINNQALTGADKFYPCSEFACVKYRRS